MGRVIPFSEIESYLSSIEKLDLHKGAILDTNILISAGYELRDSHQEVVGLWEILQKKKYRLFATVNTRSEFLEFQRRLILTENLLDMVDPQSKIKISSRARAKIQTLKGSLMIPRKTPLNGCWASSSATFSGCSPLTSNQACPSVGRSVSRSRYCLLG